MLSGREGGFTTHPFTPGNFVADFVSSRLVAKVADAWGTSIEIEGGFEEELVFREVLRPPGFFVSAFLSMESVPTVADLGAAEAQAIKAVLSKIGNTSAKSTGTGKCGRTGHRGCSVNP